MGDTVKYFARALDELLSQRSMSNHDLGAALGLSLESSSIVSGYRNGKKAIAVKRMDEIAAELETTTIDMLVRGRQIVDEQNGVASVETMHHGVIQRFLDKQVAYEINRALVVIERNSLKDFHKIWGSVCNLAETLRERIDSGPPDKKVAG
jgi:DNA-binding Xre family transcriptional regulator